MEAYLLHHLGYRREPLLVAIIRDELESEGSPKGSGAYNDDRLSLFGRDQACLREELSFQKVLA